jgi:quercetin dioxygenase-like cupin family protein
MAADTTDQAAELPAPLHVSSAQPRFGDWGPGYLAQHDHAAFGVVTLRPGDAFDNHHHNHHEESFLILDGHIELWRNRSERLLLGPGDFVRCPAGVEHFLRNTGEATARAFFVKAPGVSADKVDDPWVPEDADAHLSAPTTTS